MARHRAGRHRRAHDPARLQPGAALERRVPPAGGRPVARPPRRVRTGCVRGPGASGVRVLGQGAGRPARPPVMADVAKAGRGVPPDGVAGAQRPPAASAAETRAAGAGGDRPARLPPQHRGPRPGHPALGDARRGQHRHRRLYGPASTRLRHRAGGPRRPATSSASSASTRSTRAELSDALDHLRDQGVEGIIVVAPQRRGRSRRWPQAARRAGGRGRGRPGGGPSPVGRRRPGRGGPARHPAPARPRPHDGRHVAGPLRLAGGRGAPRRLARERGGPACGAASRSSGDWSAALRLRGRAAACAQAPRRHRRVRAPTTRWRSALLRALAEAGGAVPERRQRRRLRRHPRGGVLLAAAHHRPPGLRGRRPPGDRRPARRDLRRAGRPAPPGRAAPRRPQQHGPVRG